MHATVHNLSLLIFIFLIQFKALPVQGFLFQNDYLQKAEKQKLWTEKYWLLLGHYEKTFFGKYKSAFRGNLFIDPDGFNSPEKEMQATLTAFFSDSPELTKKYGRHPQCQFLARRRCLAQQLSIRNEDLLPCEERQKWKQQLNAKSVSLIFAASDLGNPSSSFGHTFLKVINPENAAHKDLIDYGINYAADADSSEGLLYSIKGLLGMYGGQFTMLPYHQKLREYINLEGRDIWEYPLEFSADEVEVLIDHLLEIEHSYAPYYFFSDNCSYHILKVFEIVRPELEVSKHIAKFVIPVDTVKIIRRYTNLSDKRIFKKSLKTDYLESYSKLDDQQRKILRNVVDNQASDTTINISKKKQALVFETAMKHLAVKAYQSGKDLDQEIYQLASERATLGPITEEEKSKDIEPPDQSHDSSAFYFGGGQIVQRQNQENLNFYSIKFRNAFHDFEQPDFGMVHASQSELLSFDFRYVVEQKKISLYRLTFLNLINTNPVTTLDQNLSWKIRADLMDQWTADLEGSVGISYDVDLGTGSRISYLASGRSWKENSNDFYNGAGPEILFLWKPSANLGISGSFTYFGLLQHGSFLRSHSKLSWSFRPNFDLQIEAGNRVSQEIEIQTRLVKNFLL